MNRQPLHNCNRDTLHNTLYIYVQYINITNGGLKDVYEIIETITIIDPMLAFKSTLEDFE